MTQGTTGLQLQLPAALVVIDLQGNGYQSDDTRGIPLMAGYSEVVAQSVETVDEVRSVGLPVIFTMEEHLPTLLDIGRELDGSEGPHCIAGVEGTEIAGVFNVGNQDIVIKKRRYSIFFGTDLDIILNAFGVRTLIFCGALTDVCVHYSFVDAHQRDYYCYVLKDCVIGSSPRAHRAALAAMKYLQRNAIIDRRTLYSML
jgi:nicotinamidase-related amidase